MGFLLDTNIFLEVALAQAKSAEAGRLLQSGRDDLFISDLSLHSLGIHLHRRKLNSVYTQFLDDLFLSQAIKITSLPITAHSAINPAIQSHGLDFEDAYQFCTADHFELSLISFDADFDRTPSGRLSPEKALTQPQ